MRTAYYMAQSNYGDRHEILNTSMLVILAYLFDKVIVCAPTDCCNILKKRMEQEDEHLLKKIAYRTNRYYSSFKYAIWLAGFQTLCAMLKTNADDTLFFSEFNPCYFWVYNLYNRITQRKMYTICHRDLEELSNKLESKRKNLQSHLRDYIFKKMHFAPRNKLLVLGYPIKQNLKPIVPAETFRKVIPMFHPYYSAYVNETKSNRKNSPMRIGIVGMVKEKDMENLNVFDRAMVSHDDIEVYSLSKFDGIHPIFQGITILNKENRHLDRYKYDEIIFQMDILYYPYSSDTYRLSASGAIYEAIVKGIPILAEENVYFKWLFDYFGEMGILYKGTPNWDEILKEIQNQEHILFWKKNMQRASEYINPHNYYHTFNTLINEQ